MLRAVLNKSWRQHPTRPQLYGHLPPITKTIQVRRTRHAGHCWRSKDELISDVLLWTPTHGCARVGRRARTYIQQLCEDTGCNPEDLPEAMNDREKWRETVRDIRADGATWWWWWWCLFLRLFEIAVNQVEYSRFEQRSVIKYLLVEKYKPCEIYEKISYVQKSIRKSLQMGYHWVCLDKLESKRSSMELETTDFSIGKSPGVAVSKEGDAYCLLGH